MTISQLLTCMPPLVAPNLITMTQWIFRHQFLSLVSKVPLCHVNLGFFFKDTDIFILGGKKYALDFRKIFWGIFKFNFLAANSKKEHLTILQFTPRSSNEMKKIGSKCPLWHDAAKVGLVLTLLCLDYRYIRGEEICADVFTFEFNIIYTYMYCLLKLDYKCFSAIFI